MRVKKSAFQLDPRTKLLLIAYCGSIVTIQYKLFTEIAIYVAISIFALLLGQTKLVFRFLAVYVLLMLFSLLVLPLVSGFVVAFVFGVSAMVLKFFPVGLALYLLMKTTTVSDSIAALRKIHIPDGFVIPFAVVFRFVPTLKEEWTSIRQAMKFRGIGTSFSAVVRHPMENLEYVLIPLMMSTSHIAEELAAASMSRGLAKGIKRTPMTDVKFKVADYAVTLGFPAALALSKILSLNGVMP